MNNFKVIHIHTDKKFIRDSVRFQGGVLKNDTIFLGPKYEADYGVEGVVYFIDKNETEKIIEKCLNYDLIVFYDLDILKSRIILALPKKIPIAWRFFGYELYSKKREVFLSDLSKKYITSNTSFLEKLSDFKSILKYGVTKKGVFWKAVNRVDLMFLLSHEEYAFLNTLFKNLPLPIKTANKVPIIADVEELINKRKTKSEKLIVLGNNRSFYNNHLDLIETVTPYVKSKEYNFTLLFNYGSLSKYSDDVIKEAKLININLINDFMTLEAFNEFYKNITALCINGYRQMAVANIVTAISLGIKVYLNKKNTYYQWLVNEGVKVYDINQFAIDLRNNNISLNLEEALYNVETMKNLSIKYSVEKFQNDVVKKLIELQNK